MQSDIPLNSFSPSAFLRACKRVLTTSNGLTARAAVEPAAKPAKKEHLMHTNKSIKSGKRKSDDHAYQNTASPEPSFRRGPKSLSVAKSGK